MLVPLPRGRTEPPIAGVQPQQQMGIAGQNGAVGVQVLLCIRLKIRVGAPRVIVPFAVMQQPGAGKDLLDIERFPPAGMRNDQVRTEISPGKYRARLRRLLAMPDCGVRRRQERMGIVRPVRLLRHLVNHAPDAPRREIPPLAEAYHPMRLTARHSGDQMAELPRHVLVDEQQVHGSPATTEAGNAAGSAGLNSRHVHKNIRLYKGLTETISVSFVWNVSYHAVVIPDR